MTDSFVTFVDGIEDYLGLLNLVTYVDGNEKWCQHVQGTLTCCIWLLRCNCFSAKLLYIVTFSEKFNCIVCLIVAFCLLIFPIKLLLCPFCFSPVGLARTRPALLPVPPSFPFLATELVLPGLPGQACSSHCNLDLNKHCLVLPGLRHSCTRKPEQLTSRALQAFSSLIGPG